MDFLKTTFADFEELFEEGDLKEIPVDLDTFLNDPYYLGKAKIKQISEVQRKIIESISQIYKLPTLIEIHGEEEGTRIWEEDTYHEIVAMCGKGGGKDFSSRLGFIYTIYKLHCLRDPITYYDKAHGTYIDLLNIAINADQANNVFFSPLKNLISMSPYFQEKGFEPRKSTLEFYECPIRLHSGNSEAEAWEGLDLMLVVLDEIAAFKTDSNLKNNAGGAQRLSASSIYDMSKNSVVSRFGDIGKVVLLSFPRFSGDFICQRYDESANEGGVLRIKAPTWVMNPFVTRESLEPQFKRSPVQAEMRFGCIAEGERIWTSRGLVPIEDVRDFDLVNTRFGPRRAKIWSTGKKNCLKITLNNGLHLTCSHDHGLLKINGIRRGKNKWGERRAEVDGPYVSEWVRADELKVGDRLELKSETGVFGNNGLSYDEGYLLGLILSDGWIRNDSRKYVGISCGSNRNFAERVSDTFKQTFGDCRIVEKINKNYPNNVCYDVTSTQSAVVEKIIGLGIEPVKAHEKRVPEVIWSAPEDGIKGFLTGFIDGDGSIEKGKIVSVHSTSRLLLDDLQLLLAGFGGRSSIYLNKEAGSVARAEVGEIKSNHNLYSLRVGTAGSSRIAEWLNLRSHKGDDADFNSGERIREDARIVSIEEVGEKATWDISVPGVNEFVCQGIVVHNCNPPEMIDAFFRDPAAVRQCFRGEWEVIDAGTPEEKRVLREIPELFPLNPDGTFKDWFEAKDDYPRFIHVDLGLKRDRAALCMVHSPGTRKVEIEYEVYENLPVIKMDLIHYWEAKEGQEIDFSQVREMIKLLARKFPVAKVTFDRWNSNDMVQMLNRRGIYATHHSVKKNDYDTLSTAFYDGRFSGYFVEELVEKELLKLQILNNGKVDHPEGFHDDLAQALASAVWNCCEHADLDTEIELDILGSADDWEALEYAEAVDEERRRKDRRFGKQKSSMTYDESEDDFNWHTI